MFVIFYNIFGLFLGHVTISWIYNLWKDLFIIRDHTKNVQYLQNSVLLNIFLVLRLFHFYQLDEISDTGLSPLISRIKKRRIRKNFSNETEDYHLTKQIINETFKCFLSHFAAHWHVSFDSATAKEHVKWSEHYLVKKLTLRDIRVLFCEKT